MTLGRIYRCREYEFYLLTVTNFIFIQKFHTSVGFLQMTRERATRGHVITRLNSLNNTNQVNSTSCSPQQSPVDNRQFLCKSSEQPPPPPSAYKTITICRCFLMCVVLHNGDSSNGNFCSCNTKFVQLECRFFCVKRSVTFIHSRRSTELQAERKGNRFRSSKNHFKAPITLTTERMKGNAEAAVFHTTKNKPLELSSQMDEITLSVYVSRT